MVPSNYTPGEAFLVYAGFSAIVIAAAIVCIIIDRTDDR